MADSHHYTGDEGSEELRIVESLVNSPNTTPDDTIEQITKLTKAPKTYNRQLGDHCYYTALALLKVASQTVPEKQPKLVDFFHKLRSTTVLNDSTNEPLMHEDLIIWAGMPTFGYTFADELNSIPAPNPKPGQIQQWENTIAFFAQLDASTRDPGVDFTHTWATAFISAAFGDTPRQDQAEIAVRLAAIWYIHDAEKLWSKVSAKGDFTIDDWQRWENGLQDAQRNNTDEKTLSMVGQALSEIQRVESS